MVFGIVELIANKELESKFLAMDQNIKDDGRIIKQMDQENLYIQMVIVISEHLQMMKHVEKENIFIEIHHNTKETGKMICSMDLALRNGLMVQDLRVIS